MAEAHSEERTEAPTPRRLRQARRAGQVAVSRDLTSAVVGLVVWLSLVLVARDWLGGMVLALRAAFVEATRSEPMVGALRSGLATAALALAVPLGAACLAAILFGLVQTRGLFTFQTVRFDTARIRPSASRVFGRQTWTTVGYGLVKVSIIVLVASWTLAPCFHEMAGLCGAAASKVLVAIGQSSRVLGLRLAIALLALGFTDYLAQAVRHRTALRMTRDEVKRERKDTEGEPIHKAERRRVYRELLLPFARVGMADFIVVDPGFFAAAIRYERLGQGAPIVTAKGKGLLASKMESAARASGVVVFEDATLARALMVVDVGDEIPEALYQSVAERLARAALAAQGTSSAQVSP